MQSEAAFRKVRTPQGDALMPVDDDGREIMRAVKVERDVLVAVHTPRNPRHHRVLFALIKRVMDGGVWEGDEEGLLDWIKFATGHVRTTVDHMGKVRYAPKSIAFHSMDQAAFARFFDRAVYAVCHRLLGDEDWEAVRNEIIEIVDGRFIAQANHLNETSSEPVPSVGSEEGGTSPDQDGAATSPSPDDPSSASGGGDEQSEAFRKAYSDGREAHRKGMAKKAMPKEYRDDPDLMQEWLLGFDESPDDGDGGAS